jgi:hypothetical protein
MLSWCTIQQEISMYVQSHPRAKTKMIFLVTMGKLLLATEVSFYIKINAKNALRTASAVPDQKRTNVQCARKISGSEIPNARLASGMRFMTQNSAPVDTMQTPIL